MVSGVGVDQIPETKMKVPKLSTFLKVSLSFSFDQIASATEAYCCQLQQQPTLTISYFVETNK